MKISIVTPSYNQAPYLEETLRSVHDQRGDFELEHLVIDGGSADGSVDILERWRDRLWFVSEKDNGQAHALNKGFARATGEIVGWLNSDDRYLPGALDKVARHFAAQPGRLWLTGRCLIVDDRGREIRRGITAYKNFLLRRYSYSKLLVEDFISQPATFFRRAFLDRTGALDETLRYAMDYDLWLRFGRVEAPAFVDEDLAAFRFYVDAKTGGAYGDSLREAHTVAARHAREAGKKHLAWLNYWYYYRRTVLAYSILARLDRKS